MNKNHNLNLTNVVIVSMMTSHVYSKFMSSFYM